MSCGDIAIGRDQIIFAVAESTCGGGGTITSSDAVLVVGDPSFMQARDFAEDEQKRLTVSRLSRGSYLFQAGEWNTTAYVKPSGALGTVPAPAQFLKAAFGIETITPATSVEYTLAPISADISTMLVVFKHGNIVFWNFGTVVNESIFPVFAGEGSEATGRVEMSGNFLRQKRAGVSAIDNGAGYPATTTDIVVDDAKEFEDETRIEIADGAGGWEDNGGLGYLISSVNYATNTLTIDALANPVADNAEVRGWIPTATESGSLVTGRLGTATQDYGSGPVNLLIANASVTLTNNFTVLNDEKSNSEYPTVIIKGSDRTVVFAYEQYFRKDTGEVWYEAANQTQRDLQLPVGNTAATRYRLELPKIENNTPTLSGDVEVRLGVEGEAFASSAFDDELKLVFD
jgi:hypothetical protein